MMQACATRTDSVKTIQAVTSRKIVGKTRFNRLINKDIKEECKVTQNINC